MSCKRKLALCNYCKHECRICPPYSGWCFAISPEAKVKLSALEVSKDHYRIRNEDDLALVCVVNFVDWHNYNQHGPGIYHQYYDDSCAYAMPTENLEFVSPL